MLRTHKPQTKIETRESDIYYVLASFIEVDGRPYSLELVKRTKSDDMFERENVLNQLLVRNRQVYMDSVTKVYNRRYYDERLKNLEGRFSFAMIDMDNFKHINDRFGHEAGDALIRRTADALNEVFPGEGYRIGGDEFVVLRCPIGQEDFADKVHQLREALVRHGVDAAIGSFWQPLVEDLPAFLREADDRMYREKERQKRSARPSV